MTGMLIGDSGNVKVFVAAPAGQASGGPELLQQLVSALRKRGVDAYMYYYRRVEGADPVHAEFAQYENPYVDVVDDQRQNVLIVPETKTDILHDYSNIKKVVWWLSIDFYYDAMGFSISKHGPLSIPLLRKMILFGKSSRKKKNFFFRDKRYHDYYHFVQSEYAAEHLRAKNVDKDRVFYLSDYLNADFVTSGLTAVAEDKKDIVIYNPKKGFEFTSQLIAYCSDIEFIPLENMSRAQVVELLRKAKVYIDFGEHPGKDRIPREACISGACIISGLNGSAGNAVDLPIPAGFKFARDPSNLSVISEEIRRCFAMYEEKTALFDDYREKIRAEEARFYRDVEAIFS